MECKKESDRYKTIELQNIMVPVKLGVPSLERSISQQVLMDIIIQYSNSQWLDDDLSKVSCYDTLTTQLKFFLKQNEYKTIEYFTEQVYSFLKNYLPVVEELVLSVKKITPSQQNEIGTVVCKIKGVFKNG
jgi:FolB domain-containing protein